jgi:hypothetical protein
MNSLVLSNRSDEERQLLPGEPRHSCAVGSMRPNLYIWIPSSVSDSAEFSRAESSHHDSTKTLSRITCTLSPKNPKTVSGVERSPLADGLARCSE